jgi:predicted secreted protein
MSTPIKGELGILYVHDGTIYRPIACLTSNSLNTAVSIIESQTKCDPGVVVKQAGTLSYTLDAEGEYIDTTSVGGEVTKASHDYLLTLQQALTSVTWKLDTGVTGAVYYGSAILSDLTLDQGAGDEISTFSVTLEGSGAIVTTDPEAPSL